MIIVIIIMIIMVSMISMITTIITPANDAVLTMSPPRPLIRSITTSVASITAIVFTFALIIIIIVVIVIIIVIHHHHNHHHCGHLDVHGNKEKHLQTEPPTVIGIDPGIVAPNVNLCSRL